MPCLASSLATVVKQAGRQNSSFGVCVFFLQFCIWPPVSVFSFLILYLMSDGLILFCKDDFCCIRCLSRIVFKGSILGGMHHFWEDHASLLGGFLLTQYYCTV